MKKLPIFLSLVAATLSLAACEKELEEVSAPTQDAAAAKTQSATDLLSQGSWHLTDLTTRTVAAGATTEAPSVSLLARMKPWLRDNSIAYKSGGEYSVSEGALKASAETPQLQNGAWQLNATGDSLTVRQDKGIRRYSIAELTATTLRLNYSEGTNPVTIYTSVFSR
ncbi:DUF5004 domain-containing protein [Hymenobacter elongatus]|uniref:DUF5004 domain-containing protein n=1 Tax=Hymenobacter elongatus TaxID=877208 RepID=A0A4Z0PNW9_9BACT|nr:DUF5004 domain-containing protein [Hymenobacter elongatus]TGE18879.1 DUF5004 domain-containing protein [Hymenobacter elongatus]